MPSWHNGFFRFTSKTASNVEFSPSTGSSLFTAFCPAQPGIPQDELQQNGTGDWAMEKNM